MKRRDFIGNAVLTGGILASGMISSAFAGEGKGAEARPGKLEIQDAAALAKLATLQNALAECLKRGRSCAHHCQVQLAKGETMFAECSAAVHQMIPVCEASEKLASMKSIRLREMADACVAACTACKEACEEHKAHWERGMHLECKQCAEACAATIAAFTELKKSLAA